jgi:DNA-binding NarL/FixJ family response regulator
VRLLVVEDNDLMRQSLVDRLLVEGVEIVDEATDLADALRFIQHVDGVLCDDAFPLVPGGSPFEFAWSALRDAALGLEKPFVLITGDPDTWLEAIPEGTQAFQKKDAADAVFYLLHTVRKNIQVIPESLPTDAELALTTTDRSG